MSKNTEYDEDDLLETLTERGMSLELAEKFLHSTTIQTQGLTVHGGQATRVLAKAHELGLVYNMTLIVLAPKEQMPSLLNALVGPGGVVVNAVGVTIPLEKLN